MLETLTEAVERLAAKADEVVRALDDLDRTHERYLGSLREIEALLQQEWRGERS